MLPVSVPFNSIHEQVKARVYSLIKFKTKGLRAIQSVIPEENFLIFLSSVEELENFLQETINYPWTVISNCAQGAIKQLDEGKVKALDKINFIEKELHAIGDDHEVLELVLNKIHTAFRHFQEDFGIFLDLIDDFILRRIQEINVIYNLQPKLETCNHLRLVVENNCINFRKIVTVKNVRELWKINLKRLSRIIIERYLEVSLTIQNRNQQSFSMSNNPPLPSRQRIREELRRISSSNAPLEEVQKLREKIVQPSQPLDTQKTIVRGHADKEEKDLSHRIQSLDALQMTIEDLESQVEKLREESSQAQKQLKEKREKLREGFIELLRLEKLIEQIEREMSDQTVKYQSQLTDIEKERLGIINDSSIDAVAKSRLSAEANLKLKNLTENHSRIIQDLQSKKEAAKRESRTQAEMLRSVMGDLQAHHKQELEELERRKIGASPSELLHIEEEIRQKQLQFEQNVAQIENSVNRPEYFFDEYGRYYVNADGVKIYKRDSFASEKILNPDGTWTTTKPEHAVKNDEKGEYYVDKFGQKIYKRQIFHDENGDYYLDDHGNRVFINEGVSVYQTSSCISNETKTSTSIDSDEYRRQDNIRYIMETLGRPLRLGLASITLRQPDDPINYLANFLIQYRYNEMRHEQSNRQLDEILVMRQQLQQEEELREAGTSDSCQSSGRI